jgi:hypothetical protein
VNGIYGAGSSDWEWVVRRPPAADILAYLHAKWKEYEARFAGVGPSFSDRDEPTLTEGFAAFLALAHESGSQPFDGIFVAERKRYDLQPDGRPQVIGRTDIEWILDSTAGFIVEFKIVGGGRPAAAYVKHGIERFVDGRYGHRAIEGAMWALIRNDCSDDEQTMGALVERHASRLRCQAENGAHLRRPSSMAPVVASFDTVHLRSLPLPAIRLAHLFVKLP